VGGSVIVDGQLQGNAPLTVTLAAGLHTVILQHGADERVIPIRLSAGAEIVHHVDFRVVDPAQATGGISVVTDPPSAQVLLDGQPRGTSPLMLRDLTPAKHVVKVISAAGSAEQTIMVTPGAIVPVKFSWPQASPVDRLSRDEVNDVTAVESGVLQAPPPEDDKP
jgi:hypothetical protein